MASYLEWNKVIKCPLSLEKIELRMSSLIRIPRHFI